MTHLQWLPQRRFVFEEDDDEEDDASDCKCKSFQLSPQIAIRLQMTRTIAVANERHCNEDDESNYT